MKSKIVLGVCALMVLIATGCKEDDGVGGKRITIESIHPQIGGPGTELIVNGTGFPLDISRIALSVNDISFAVERCNEEQILAVVPENEAIGKAPVVVAIGSKTCRSRMEFTYFDSRMRIESVFPLQGSAGTEVTVVGRNFPEDGSVSVSINAVALDVVDADATKIVVTIPDDPEIGTGPIVVKAGDKTAESADEFAFTDLIMSVSSVSPLSAGPGVDVTITGENFPAGATPVVTVNDIAFEVESTTATEIVATVPENDAVGTGRVKIVAGRKTAYSEQDFVYVVPVVRISSFSPASAGSGMEVTIAGENFSADKSQVVVSVNDVEFPVKSATERELVVTVPVNDNIGTGKIKVVAKGRTGFSESDFQHIVSNMSVSSFVPASAPFDTELTITGENFPEHVEDVKVSVNGVAFEVKSIGATQIVAVVPKNKTIGSGKILLTDLYGSCESDGEFTYELTRVVSVLAGTGTAGYHDGSAAEAQFNLLIEGQYGGIAVDKELNVYVADVGNLRLRRIAWDGTVSTYGGNDTPDWGADWSTNTNATPLDVYMRPLDVAYDKTNHRLFVGDYSVQPSVMIDIASNKVSYAGWAQATSIAMDNISGALYFSRVNSLLAKTDGKYGPGAEAGVELNQKAGISGLAVDGEGNLYVSVASENKIYKYVKGQWNTPVLVAGTGMAGCKDGPALEAEFSAPGRMCFDNSGNLLVAGNATAYADSGNADQSIRYIDLLTNTVTTFAGAGTVGSDGDSFVVDSYGGSDNRTTVLPAVFTAPSAIAVDKNDVVYVFDRGSHTVKKIVTE